MGKIEEWMESVMGERDRRANLARNEKNSVMLPHLDVPADVEITRNTKVGTVTVV
jgi:hypothetical protein